MKWQSLNQAILYILSKMEGSMGPLLNLLAGSQCFQAVDPSDSRFTPLGLADSRYTRDQSIIKRKAWLSPQNVPIPLDPG